MRTGSLRFFTLVLAAAFGVAMAQDVGEMKAGRDAVAKRFEAAAPTVGATVPDVSVVDAKGRVHGLRDLTGEHYTVLVLGCLT